MFARLNIIQKFSIFSLLWVIFFVIISGVVLAYHLESTMIEREGSVTSDFVKTMVDERLISEDFKSVSPSQRRFTNLFKAILLIPDIVAINAYDKDGKIIWSDFEEIIGRKSIDNIELEKAILGDNLFVLRKKRRSNESHLTGYNELLEVYTPIKNGAETVGVVTTFKSSKTLFAKLKKGRMAIWKMSAAGGLIFYISFFSFFYRAYKTEKAMHEGIQKLNRELTTINEVIVTLSRSLNLQQLLKDVMEKVFEVLGAKAGSIFLAKKDNKNINHKVSIGFSDEELNQIESESKEERLSCIKNNMTEAIPFNLSSQGISKGPSVRVPLVSGGNTLGLMELTFPEDKKNFPYDEKELFTSIGHQIGVSVEKARLYQEVKEFGQGLEVMVEERTIELERSRDEIQAIFDAVTDIIVVSDMEHNIIMANRSALEIFGINSKDILGKRCYELFKGSSSPCDGCVEPETINKDKSYSLEITNIETEEIYNISTFPMRDESGNIRAIIEYAKVITEQKQMEEQVIQMEKLSTLGELLGEIAHQINNPLVGVVNYAQMALKQLDEDQPVREELEVIEKAGLTCKDTIKKLLEFTRPATFEWEVLDCNKLIDESITMIGQQMGLNDIKVKKDFSKTLPPVKGDSTLMTQVFFNLINNAREAMGKSGTLTIATNTSEDTRVNISFSDTGPGIKKDNLAQVFSPFFTTKRDEGGTGLGLSVVSNIVVRHKGKIWASSKVSGGTTFTITLPAEL